MGDEVLAIGDVPCARCSGPKPRGRGYRYCRECGPIVRAEGIDAFLFRSYRPQDPTRGQQHARRNYSTLLVFEHVRPNVGDRLL